MVRISAIIISFVTVGYVYAAESPPRTPSSSINWPTLSSSKPTTGFKMGDFGIIYEETSLGEIKSKIGSGRIDHEGDAAESTYWLCYTVQQERIWIMSGEMGGSKHDVLNVAVKSGEFKASTDCPELPVQFQPISFDHGLRVGETEYSVVKALGSPSHREGKWMSYNYTGKEDQFCKPWGADVTNWALFEVENGHVISIRAGQVTSC